MHKLIIFVLFGLLVAFGCNQLPGIENDLSDDIEIIHSGHYSMYSQKGKVHRKIKSKPVFVDEWNKVHAGSSPIPDLPDVNFNHKRVALIMLEGKPSGGYDIGEIEVYESGRSTVIAYSEVAPNGCGTTQAITRPFVFLSYPGNGHKLKFHKKEEVINSCGE